MGYPRDDTGQAVALEGAGGGPGSKILPCGREEKTLLHENTGA